MRTKGRKSWSAKLLLGVLCLWTSCIANAQTLRGVNLVGPALSGDALPGVYGWNFIYPNDGEITYFTQHGMNIFRISLLWERLQPALNGKLDPAELFRLSSFINDAEAHGASVLIDIHNYGYYRGTLIGQKGVGSAAFANLWTRLAQRFGQDPRVLFGLMNEPKEVDAQEWQQIVQQSINAVRATGAKNRILIPGIDWDSAQGFAAVSGATLGKLHDPQDRIVFEVHEYFDTDSSGTSDRCVSPGQAIARFSAFTNWLRSNSAQGFLGEFGVSRRPECLTVLNKVAAYLKANSDVWLGWTYWAAGPMWGDYMFSLEPLNGADRPQMKVLQAYLEKSGIKQNE